MMTKALISLRPLQRNDAAFLCSIFRDNKEYYQIFFDPADTIAEWEQRIDRFLNQTEVQHYIIEANKSPVGWISYSDITTQERELCILVLHKNFLGKRYGECALSWLIRQSKTDKMKTIALNVNQNNNRAIGLYQKYGFQICGEEIIPQCNEAINLPQYKMQLHLS